MTSDTQVPVQNEKSGALEALESLRMKAKLNKDRHFAAAERKTHYQTWIGVAIIVINALVGTVVISILSQDPTPQWGIVVASVCSFSAASLSAIQTFFKFNRIAEGHRSVANRYLDVKTQCEQLLLRARDQQIANARVWEMIDHLREEYNEVNIQAEAFPTGKRDFESVKERHSLVPFTSKFVE